MNRIRSQAGKFMPTPGRSQSATAASAASSKRVLPKLYSVYALFSFAINTHYSRLRYQVKARKPRLTLAKVDKLRTLT
jgi:hypothetical protein